MVSYICALKQIEACGNRLTETNASALTGASAFIVLTNAGPCGTAVGWDVVDEMVINCDLRFEWSHTSLSHLCGSADACCAGVELCQQ